MSDNSPAAAGSPAPDSPAAGRTAADARTVDVRIRPAIESDLPAVNDIYNYYVLHSTATYQEEPEPIAGRAAWFARHGPRHPVTVAVDSAGAVLGWASLSPFHARSAYRFTAENSVYLRPDARGRGIGTLLLADLIARARAAGHRSILALIDADQPASVALHRRFGFGQVAHLRQVGFKFGRWLDVVYMQLVLDAANEPTGIRPTPEGPVGTGPAVDRPTP